MWIYVVSDTHILPEASALNGLLEWFGHISVNKVDAAALCSHCDLMSYIHAFQYLATDCIVRYRAARGLLWTFRLSLHKKQPPPRKKYR